MNVMIDDLLDTEKTYEGQRAAPTYSELSEA